MSKRSGGCKSHPRFSAADRELVVRIEALEAKYETLNRWQIAWFTCWLASWLRWHDR